MKKLHLLSFALTAVITILWAPLKVNAQYAPEKFVHPGINQTKADLDFMKEKVLAGEQPWKDAFEKVKAADPLNYVIKIEPHIIQGAYNVPDIGGKLMSDGAQAAYNCALLWYITGDKVYAAKAIEIMNAWSKGIWDFDDNNAKLLVALSGQVYANAAEIIRYSGAGWKEEDIKNFEDMLLSVFYPIIRFYFPEANGNWNGAIERTIMAIAVFTDNRPMFDNAVNNYLYAPNNGSILKYVYPTGQCQETIRDQPHVQMGLREFAGAARIAFSQGVDLFSVADSRLALGIEWTAKLMMDKYPDSYGTISEYHKNLKDDYEAAYRHYTAQGFDMKYTKMAADATRDSGQNNYRDVLTSWRAPGTVPVISKGEPKPLYTVPAGASIVSSVKFPAGHILVKPGESIQDALNRQRNTGGWVVLGEGVHTLNESLDIPSGVTLCGQGRKTIIHNGGGKVNRMLINTDENLHDLTIRDLIIEGSKNVVQLESDPNTDRMQRYYRMVPKSTGIIFLSKEDGQMKNINLINVTVQHASLNGVYISGAGGVTIENCDFTDNGSGLVPGPRHHHNLLLAHVTGANIKGSRFAASPMGCGIAIDKSRNVNISETEIARNDWYGLKIVGSDNIKVSRSLIEGNSAGGVLAEYLGVTNSNIDVSGNLIQFNNGYGVESYGSTKFTSSNNNLRGNGSIKGAQEKISNDKTIIMAK